MRMLLSFTLAGIMWGLSAPAQALPGRAESQSTGIIARCRPRPHVTIAATGLLQQRIAGLEQLALVPRPGQPRWPRAKIQVWWELTVNGRSYVLNIPEREDWHDQANQLNGRTVVVTGELVGGTIHVRAALRAADASARTGVRVHIEGYLNNYGMLTSEPPIPMWQVTVNGKTYWLGFYSAALAQRAEKLVGRLVWVSGELQGESVVVSDLVAVPPLRC